jgi:hypothetical protein
VKQLNHAMKLNMEPARKNCEDMASCMTQTTQRVKKPRASAKTRVPERFRRLKWNEVVCRGDFVADERRGLEPWEGPGGFRADAFVKMIYRRKETERLRLTAIGKSGREK